MARVFSQKEGVDCDEMFSPVAHYTSIRTIIALASAMGWRLHQMNLKKLSDAAADSDLVDPMVYRQLVGSLMYLVNNRLDICFTVSTLGQLGGCKACIEVFAWDSWIWFEVYF